MCRPAGDRRCVIQLQNELDVSPVNGRGLVLVGWIGAGELVGLPELPFVFAEILHHKRPQALNAEQPFSRRVNGEAPKVARDPTAIEFFGNCCRRAASDEAIEDEVAFVR